MHILAKKCLKNTLKKPVFFKVQYVNFAKTLANLFIDNKNREVAVYFLGAGPGKCRRFSMKCAIGWSQIFDLLLAQAARHMKCRATARREISRWRTM